MRGGFFCEGAGWDSFWEEDGAFFLREDGVVFCERSEEVFFLGGR